MTYREALNYVINQYNLPYMVNKKLVQLDNSLAKKYKEQLKYDYDYTTEAQKQNNKLIDILTEFLRARPDVAYKKDQLKAEIPEIADLTPQKINYLLGVARERNKDLFVGYTYEHTKKTYYYFCRDQLHYPILYGKKDKMDSRFNQLYLD